MATVETRYEHVVLEDGHVPMIAGTRMKVLDLVVAQRAYGWSPEELAFQYRHLTLGQIHSALAFYWDHQPELDQQIQRDLEFVDRLRRDSEARPAQARLRALRRQ
ncbi:MAG: DUF433 domain-containing protein [Chloroflexota bacterium]